MFHRAMSHVASQKVIRSFKDAEKAIKRAAKAERPLVIKFYAPWCEPCKLVAPWFDSFSEAYSDGADFAIANVDHDDDIAQAYGVRIIPAFHVWNRGVRVATLGRDPEAIERTLRGCLVRKTNEKIRAEISRGYAGDDESNVADTNRPKGPIVTHSCASIVTLKLDETRSSVTSDEPLPEISLLTVKKRRVDTVDMFAAG